MIHNLDDLIWPIVFLTLSLVLYVWHMHRKLLKHTSRIETQQQQLLTLQGQFDSGEQIAHFGIWHFDHIENRLSWTKGVHQIFETDPESFVVTYDAFLAFVHPEDRAELAKTYDDSIHTRQPYSIKHRVVLENGAVKHLQERCEHAFDHDGNPLSSTGTVHDITRQVSLENDILSINQALESKIYERTRELQTMLSLFDKGESIMFKCNNDEHWSVEYVSKSVKKVLGYSRDDFLTHQIDYASCIHPEDLPRVLEEVARAKEQKIDYFELEPYRVLTKGGETKWVHDSTIVVYNELQEVSYFIGYITDITSIKEQDHKLLMQTRMAQMGEMISMIAHQWRQPLSAIAASIINFRFEIEMQDEKSDSQKLMLDELKRVDSYVSILTQTIDDFRNFYKPDKKAEDITLSSCVESALTIVENSLYAHNITIIKKYQKEPSLHLLKNEMMQVILNILKNAQDNFMQKEIADPTIVITCNATEDHATLEIEDNGGGIDNDIVEHIFDPYFSTKDEKNGSGLGLYMSKTIIEKHHKGQLLVRNTPEGACFSIIIDRTETETKPLDEKELMLEALV